MLSKEGIPSLIDSTVVCNIHRAVLQLLIWKLGMDQGETRPGLCPYGIPLNLEVGQTLKKSRWKYVSDFRE